MLRTIAKLDFSELELWNISDVAKQNSVDGAYLIQIMSAYLQRIADTSLAPIENPAEYICAMIEQGNSHNNEIGN